MQVKSNADCVLWTKSTNSSGYGVLWKGGKQVYAHRDAIGAKEGDIVMHVCDNKTCVNPNHLRIGTYAENSKDMVLKNRQATGERCGNSKLTQDSVLQIKKYLGVLSSRKVAQMFNISKTNVLDIWKNKIWKHL